MTSGKRNTKSPPIALRITTADDALFKLHDAFCRAYAHALSLQAGSSIPVKNPTKKEKALERKWNRAVVAATDKARATVDAPAHTLEGMLMKIHVAGFVFNSTRAGTFSAPYHGLMCANGRQHWEPSEKFGISDEIALITSLRNDLNFGLISTEPRWVTFVRKHNVLMGLVCGPPPHKSLIC
jgi:hypothetical protein